MIGLGLTNVATVLLLHVQFDLVTALSATTDISIVGLPGGATQSLPGQYVKTFGRWSTNAVHNLDDDDRPESTVRIVPERLRGAGRIDGTYVDPTSTTELWWPSDIPTLQVRPTLDVLVKSGSPAYVSAGLNIRVPPSASANREEWRNYGLHSQPLARQWTTFGFAVEPNFRVETFVGRQQGRVEGEEDNKSGGPTKKWERICRGNLGALDDTAGAHSMFASQRMKNAIETVGVLLSDIDEDSPLSDGFHIVSFPLYEEWTDLPPVGGGGGNHGYTLLSMATAEPDAEELLRLDEGLVAMTATGVLEVDVSQTSPGCDSEYLPDAYWPLYVR